MLFKFFKKRQKKKIGNGVDPPQVREISLSCIVDYFLRLPQSVTCAILQMLSHLKSLIIGSRAERETRMMER